MLLERLERILRALGGFLSALGELLNRLQGILSALGAILIASWPFFLVNLHGPAWNVHGTCIAQEGGRRQPVARARVREHP